ncbi:MAG: PsiF family protein [Pseudomonadota bacterium]
MKLLMTVLALSAACLSSSAFAADAASAPMGKQQSRMTSCNKEAGDKKGDERRAFMKTCLSAKATPSQQDKMKACNADPKAKAAKGDERRAFMKECLSK